MTNYDSGVTAAFDAIATGFAATARCEMPGDSGGRCQDVAAWLMDFHGCSRGLMCDRHRRASGVSMAAAFGRGLGAPCNWCGQHFLSVDTACKVVEL